MVMVRLKKGARLPRSRRPKCLEEKEKYLALRRGKAVEVPEQVLHEYNVLELEKVELAKKNVVPHTMGTTPLEEFGDLRHKIPTKKRVSKKAKSKIMINTTKEAVKERED